MPPFQSKPFRPNSTRLSRFVPKVRRHPVLLFGLPFILTIVGASFGLSTLTQTRYDYNATKVQSISKEEELRMKKDRRRIDIREEYFKLQAKGDDLDDWEPKRIERPNDSPDWVPPTGKSAIMSEPLDEKVHAIDQVKYEDIPRKARRGDSAEEDRKVVLGPDGKPCRACNSKLAFAAAMRGSKLKEKEEKGTKREGALVEGGEGETGGNKVKAGEESEKGSPDYPKDCPPDVEELGRSTWTFLHSVAAYYPSVASEEERRSALKLVESLARLYPCQSCAEALREELKREKAEGGWEEKSLVLGKAVERGVDFRRWLCGIHNEVNERLGKPKFDCSEELLRKRWKDGWDDGRCDG
ncbi:FAD-dependent thiol oxidase [Violaceomyces palustris]|uniref:FAD-dependent thiol oxidase n=1 Tax=Violaceomyces palustris TaxID=1673888 RepID=A0ACD0NQU4_9BASI|nr:FAD-dependent thiol oxidase [Violaceomyces palustris]